METKAAELRLPEMTFRENGLHVVAIGGGTGLSTLLKGLKRYVLSASEVPASGETAVIRDLSAVVTVSDDGGSSGRLRKELNMLPPGDIRNCIVALSEDEALLSKLFRHRFDKGSGLEGHSFGNLFLAALTSLTADFSEAVRLSSEILLTRGRIFPATTSNIELEALMEDGTRVRGETRITASKGRIQELFLTQPNESLGLTAADHIRALNRHAQTQLFDYALINRTPASENLKAKYALEGAAQIVADLEAVEQLGCCPVLGDYLGEGEVARHATDAVARDLLDLALQP